jgi:predicted dithiol-disulfide oxidoreductase (DUF899 family)
MTTHKTGTREQWVRARLELLKAEKELTHGSDEVARQRQELPWVPIKKGYRFETDEESASLAELFRGRSQLLVYHFMFGPDFAAGCPSCSSIADGFNGIAAHFCASYTEEQQRKGGIEYNYRREAPLQTGGREGAEISRSTPDGAARFAAMCGTDAATYIRERPGMSAFALEDGVIYHTYSTYARGLDGLWGMYPWLDRAPKGRNETGLWWRRHDEYGK